MAQTVYLRTGPIVDDAPRREPYLMAEMSDLDKPAPMTRAALRALRTAGGLEKDCHYVITDYSRGTVGAATILLHAVDANTLGTHAHIKTTFDNVAWTGTYDIDANRIESLHDTSGNNVYGAAAVDAFPWGVATVTENEIHESTINYTAGTFSENKVDASSVIDVNGGSINRNRISSGVRAFLNGTFNDNVLENNVDITVLSGTNIENRFGGSSRYEQVGTGYIRYSVVDSNSTVVNGNTNISNTSFISGTSVNTTGSTGTISDGAFNRAIASAMQNVPSLNIIQSTFESSATIQVTGAALVRLYRSSSNDGGRWLVSAGASLTANNSHINSYGYIQVTSGTLLCQYSKATALGYISHQSTGSNRVDRSEASDQGNIRFLDSVDGGRVFYSKASTGGTIYQNGTSTNCYHYYCDASSLAQIYVQNSTNARHYYCSASSYAYIRAYGTNTGQSIMYYCNATARSFIEHNNITARQRFYSINTASQAIVRQTGGAAAANLYYSGAHSYYYLFLSQTGVTRSGLFGYGRQTFTGNPATNGTGTRNWT